MADAIDEFIALPRDQQLTTLQKLAPDKQDALLGEVKKRRAAPSAAPQQGLDHTFGNYATAAVKAPFEGLNDAVEGAYGTIVHPWDTVKALVTQPLKAIKASADEFNQTKGQPLSDRIIAGTLTGLEQEPIIGNIVQGQEGGHGVLSPENVEATLRGLTQFWAPEAVGPMGRKLADTAKATREAALRGVTKTGPSVTRALVEDTAAKNADAAAKYEAKAAPIRETAQAAEQLNAAERGDTPQPVQYVKNNGQVDYDATLQSLPPVKAGDVRLFRSESPTVKFDDVFKRDKLKDFNNRPADAKSYTDNLEYADYYRQSYGKDAATTYIDVPSDVAQASKLAEGEYALGPRGYKPRLAAVEKRVHADADAKYAELNPKLHPLPVDMENVGTTIEHALGELDAATPEPPLLTKLRKLSENSALDYGDLDSFRKSIGSALRKGGLPGTVYHVYDTLMNGGLDEEGNAVPGIVDEMQRIASDKGMAAEADAARSSWRDWAQAFRDRKSPLQKVLADPEPHGLLKRFRDKEASGIGVLQKFDPQLASDINGSLSQMEDIGAPRGRSPLPVPKVPDAPQPTVLTPEDVTAAKQQKAVDRADTIRNLSNHLATVFVTLDVIRRLTSGDLPGMGKDIAARVGYAWGKNAFANALESPKTLDAVGKLTPEDVQEVMKLPPEQRAGFDELLNQAQARGVKLKPGVMDALFGTAKRAAQVGPKTQRLRDLQQQQAPQ